MMTLSNIVEMDQDMLYSLLNMKLRNHCEDLNDLARSLDIDERALVEHMRGKGFEYDPEIGQFR